MNNFDIKQLAWEKSNGLIPAIIQDARSGTVLMLAYMDQDALRTTLVKKRVTFYSRSKKRLWTKGETSGNYLELVSVHPDCDQDTLLIQAIPTGPACHLGNKTCFNSAGATAWEIIQELEKIIQNRKKDLPEKSYVTSLLKAGIKKIAQKVGEEGVEVALAAVSDDANELSEEAADLVFHLLILLQARELSLADVLRVLQARRK
ncbi:MAG: bifunctional phosphoribosyl-AMP cyclohydrolase/phosphoribosyl-ATP diphosphatase HisIE [Gammaproteobacteria bacterium]